MSPSNNTDSLAVDIHKVITSTHTHIYLQIYITVSSMMFYSTYNHL